METTRAQVKRWVGDPKRDRFYGTRCAWGSYFVFDAYYAEPRLIATLTCESAAWLAQGVVRALRQRHGNDRHRRTKRPRDSVRPYCDMVNP